MGWDSSLDLRRLRPSVCRGVPDLHETSFQGTSVRWPLGIVLKHWDVSYHQDVTCNREATWGSQPTACFLELSHGVIVSDRISQAERPHPSWHPLSAFPYVVWSMVWQLLLQVLWWPAFQSDMASVRQQSWNAYSGLMELSGFCDWCHQTSTPTVHFCAVLVSFLDHHDQCAERAVASAMLSCLFGGLCKPSFVAAGDMIIYLFFGWTLRFQLPAESSHWTRGRGHPHCHPELSSLQGAQPPYIYIYSQLLWLWVSVTSVCAAGPQTTGTHGEKGNLSTQLYKTLCCIRHPKIVPTCFLVTPGGMRHHQWGIVGLKTWTKSGAEEAEFPESKAATRKVSLL